MGERCSQTALRDFIDRAQCSILDTALVVLPKELCNVDVALMLLLCKHKVPMSINELHIPSGKDLPEMSA